MDPLLFDRYMILLADYCNGQEGLINEIKAKLIEEKDNIRPDGVLCLLTLYQEMILKPYHGPIYFTPRKDGATQVSRPLLLDVPKIGQEKFQEKVWSSLFSIKITNLARSAVSLSL